MFKKSYTKEEFENLVKNVSQRRGWDFSRMNTQRQPVPWIYQEIVAIYLRDEDQVLDIGTGGGENFLKLAKLFKSGIGIDIDLEMVKVARENGKEFSNVSFYQDTDRLESSKQQFDVILNRHAPFDLEAIYKHLKPKGYFITQQVGEKNMLNIKKVIHKDIDVAVISKEMIENSNLKLLAFMEYDVENIVTDVESLVFWLHALDMLHADLSGASLLGSVTIFNQILDGNVDERGFVTNEQRFLVITQK